MNRLGQRGRDDVRPRPGAYAARVAAFGWETIVIDGHDMAEILAAYAQARRRAGRPLMIIASTIKGKGVSFIEDRNGWHGKALDAEQLEAGAAGTRRPSTRRYRRDLAARGLRPESPSSRRPRREPVSYPPSAPVATREAYGNALKRLYPGVPADLVSLDGEVGNSTNAEIFQRPTRSASSRCTSPSRTWSARRSGSRARGKIPFVSTFAAFFTRAFDQIRMSQYSDANIKFCGSHAGVSIGEDGPSQMGLEDIAMFRTLIDGVVLYPCDAVSTERLVEAGGPAPRDRLPADHAAGDAGALRRRRGVPDRRLQGAAHERAGRGDGRRARDHGARGARPPTSSCSRQGMLIRVIDLYSVKPVDANDAARGGRARPGRS